MTPFAVLFYLIGSHPVCDYALQSQFMADGKNPNNSPLYGVHWFWVMSAHCYIHGIGVALVTGVETLGILEIAAHFLIDYRTCMKYINHHVDQILHVLCKVVWFVLYLMIWR